MAIPDSFLDELRMRSDIEEIVERYVSLRRGGVRRVGLCPFHSEKTPSFTVFSDTQSFYCFGCGAGGDVINFIQRIENLDWLDAVRFLAEQAGMALPDSGATEQLINRRRDAMLRINRSAARFFHETLMGEAGAAARRYLESRRLSPGTIRRFGLGFAPDSWDALKTRLLSEGYDEEDIAAAGLIKVSEKEDGANKPHSYDRFRNRVMFPIIDTRGNVIGFGGRVMDNSLPKYLNSPDSVVFKKSLQLYALNFAKNRNGGRLILAEGYMDVISLHQAGFCNAVATLGTAITQEQARLMSRYAKEVVIAYDSDEAGQKAAKKAITLLTAAGLDVKVISLAGGKDPDEYIKTYGAEQFKLVLEGSDSHIMYEIERAKHGLDITVPDNKVEFLKRAAEILCTVPSAVEREVYAERIAQDVGVSKDSLMADIAVRLKKRMRAQQKSAAREQTALALGQRDIINPEKRRHPKAARAEEALIAVLLRHPDRWRSTLGSVKPSDFVTEFNRRMYEALVTRLSEGQSVDLQAMSAVFSPDEMARLSYCLNGVVLGDDIEAQIKEFADILKREKGRIGPSEFRDMDREALIRFARDAAALKR